MRALRSGYTTGACAAAAAKGAALLLRDGQVGDAVELLLPGGERVAFRLQRRECDAHSATCSVLKDAGDDPDVTNGAEVVARVQRDASAATGLTITGGSGIGKVTKPGLAVAIGEWAINPVPRRMIEAALREVLPDGGLTVTISIPDGEERAKRTLNSRLGIIGGLSILGTTGIVRPISAQAWTDTIDTSLDVARACGCPTVVLCTGRTSEQAAMKYFSLVKSQSTACQGDEESTTQAYMAIRRGVDDDVNAGRRRNAASPLPEEAFIMMGDHVAHAARSCVARGFPKPVLACQFAKLVKIACGHANTHAAASRMDLSRLAEWLQADQAPQFLSDLAIRANTARELALTADYHPELLATVARRVILAMQQHAPQLAPTVLICGYDGDNAWPYPRQPHEK